jgi:hypothetical protein
MRVLTLILDFSLSLLRVSHQFTIVANNPGLGRETFGEISRVAIGRTLRNDAYCRFEGLVSQVATDPC